MIVTNGTLSVDISRELLEYCPYIQGMIGVEESRRVSVDNIELLLSTESGEHCTDKQFIALTSFLRGGRFQVDEDIYPFFEFTGFPNDSGYPLEFYSVRLRDRWIRDHMYSLRLHDVDDYALVDITDRLPEIGGKINVQAQEVLKDMIHTTGNVVVAGGSVLHALGITDKTSDIDMFVVDSDGHEILNRLTSMHEFRLYHQERCTQIYRSHEVSVPLQLIHRRYRSMSEVVHGFDLDCCGVLYDGEKYYCTERTLYSLRNRCNWVDHTRSSPSYVYRLLKYSQRGFKVKLPGITSCNLNMELLRRSMGEVAWEVLHCPVVSRSTRDEDITRLEYTRYPVLDQDMEDMVSMSQGIVDYSGPGVIIYFRLMHMCGLMHRFRSTDALCPSVSMCITPLLRYDYDNEETKWNGLTGKQVLSSDLQFTSRLMSYLSSRSDIHSSDIHGSDITRFTQIDKLLFSGLLGIDLYQDRISDYESDTIQRIPLCKVVFNTQDPMTQVTSTWNPEDIPDMETWYQSSKYYHPDELFREHKSDTYNLIVSEGKFIACRSSERTRDIANYRVIQDVMLDDSVRDLFKIVPEDAFMRYSVTRNPIKFLQVRESMISYDPDLIDGRMPVANRRNVMIGGISRSVLSTKRTCQARSIRHFLAYALRLSRIHRVDGMNMNRLASILVKRRYGDGDLIVDSTIIEPYSIPKFTIPEITDSSSDSDE